MKSAHIMVRLLSALLCVLICFGVVPAFAEEASTPSLNDVSSLLLYYPQTDSVILSKNEATPLPAGSTVKLLSGLLLCELLSYRQNDIVYVTESMVKDASGYRYHLKAGDEYSVRELLYLALCGSYNDAYEVLSLYLADTKEIFLNWMSQRAMELGATQSSFLDISGIKDNSQTTAKDLLKIALAAQQNELYMELSSTLRYKLSDGVTIKNRNELISSNTYYNAYCKGMTAGSTASAGNCVITTVDNGKEVYLCVLLGGRDGANEANLGYETVNRLIKWVYSTYSYIEVISPETPICTIPVTVSDLTSEVEVRANTSLSCYLPAGLEIGKDITYSVRLMYTSLEAPVCEGQMVGYVAILWNGKTLGTVPLYTTASAERSSFVSSLKSIQSLTEGRVFRAGVIFFVLTLTGWIITETTLLRRRRHKWDKYFSEKLSPPPMNGKRKPRSIDTTPPTGGKQAWK